MALCRSSDKLGVTREGPWVAARTWGSLVKFRGVRRALIPGRKLGSSSAF